MYKLVCDLCGKEILHSAMMSTITVETTPIYALGTSEETIMHFHIECGTRLNNMFNHFVAKIRAEGDDK